MPASEAPTTSLPTLLSQALIAFTIEFDNTAEERITAAGPRPWIASLAMWANYLRFVGDEGVHARELQSRALVSEGAIRSRLGALRRWRYLVVDPDHVVRLTAAGRRARAVWEPLGEEIEDRWRERFGEERIARLRTALESPLGGLDLELPRYLPVVGYGMVAEVVTAADPLPPQPDGHLDLSVLLARTLLGFTLEFEGASKLSLPVCADGLRVLGEDATRVRDLPRLAGVSKEALAMLVGFLARARLATVAPDPSAPRGQAVSLTPKGLAARRASGRLAVDIEERWRQRFGTDAIDELRAGLRGILDARAGDAPLLAQGLVPPPGGWRARRPYLTQTQAVLRDPRAALRRYPMVLHRGGFPDGS
jgi:DNA-binding MarR family transcriptional regulator